MSSPTSFRAFSYVNEGGSRELLNLNTNLEDLELRALRNVSQIGICIFDQQNMFNIFFQARLKIVKAEEKTQICCPSDIAFLQIELQYCVPLYFALVYVVFM